LAAAVPAHSVSTVEQGHRIVPHTADIRVEAWGPSRESCIAEAVLAMVSTFADTSSVHPNRAHECWFAERSDEDLLVAVLDEVIYLLDTEQLIPVDMELEASGDGVDVRFAMADASAAEQVGAAPKGVSLHGLRVSSHAGGWMCSVIVDV
jgi:SHS2 domain-containing protein